MIMNIGLSYKMFQAYTSVCKELCRKIEIPQTAFDILMFLANNPQYNTAKDIVNLRGIKANLVSVNVDRLVQEGYLKRTGMEGDRRKYILTCEKKAEPIIEKGRELQQAFYEKVFEGLDQEKREVFREVIQNIEKNIDEIMKGAKK